MIGGLDAIKKHKDNSCISKRRIFWLKQFTASMLVLYWVGPLLFGLGSLGSWNFSLQNMATNMVALHVCLITLFNAFLRYIQSPLEKIEDPKLVKVVPHAKLGKQTVQDNGNGILPKQEAHDQGVILSRQDAHPISNKGTSLHSSLKGG